MPTVSGVTSHFPTAKEGFSTTLSGSIASGAATVGLNSTTGYSDGDVVVLVVDPADAVLKQAFTGIVSGTTITDVVWTEGTDQAHAAGATVVDYVSATHMAIITKGLEVQHNQDGTHKAITAPSINLTGAVTAATAVIGGTPYADAIGGWVAGSGTWTYASATTFTVPAADAAAMSVGTKIRLVQTTTKYFYVTGVSGTTITITGGSDYTLANAAITSPFFSNATTPVGFPNYFAWAITWTNITVGNATVNRGRFCMHGRQIHAWVHFEFGSTSDITGSVSFSLPVAPSTLYVSGAFPSIGTAYMHDAGSSLVLAGVNVGSGNTANIRNANVSGGNVTTADSTTTTPFDTVNGDDISANIVYEAA